MDIILHKKKKLQMQVEPTAFSWLRRTTSEFDMKRKENEPYFLALEF